MSLWTIRRAFVAVAWPRDTAEAGAADGAR